MEMTELRPDRHEVVSLVFFFSSRRRHTRWPRDWSSDVCSSDLFLHQGSSLRFLSLEGTSIRWRVFVNSGQLNANLAIGTDRKSTRLNSSHVAISYAVFCLKKKKKKKITET